MTGYARASSGEFVDGQVINASDSEAEFAAILAAFHASTGHVHDGTAGDGPVLNVTAALTGILPSKLGGVHTATANPVAGDDTPDHQIGSIWVNTNSDEVFICTSNASTAAIWKKITCKATGSNPGSTNDIDEGYEPGSIWVNTTTDTIYICVNSTDGGALWTDMTPPTVDEGQLALFSETML